MNTRPLLFGTPGHARTLDAGLLVLRVAMFGLLALGHGLGKLPVSQDFIDTTAGMGFPLPVLFAWAAALAEFGGGLLLVLGLLTRPTAFFVAFTMLVAIVGVHEMALMGPTGGEKPFLYLIGAVTLMLTGPGRFSVDAQLARRAPAY